MPASRRIGISRTDVIQSQVVLVRRHPGTDDWFAFPVDRPQLAFGGDRPEVAVARLIQAVTLGERYRVVIEGPPTAQSAVMITASRATIDWAQK